MTEDDSAAERKRKRLEAWRKRQQQASPAAAAAPPTVKVSLSLAAAKLLPKKKQKKPITKPKEKSNNKKKRPFNAFGDVDDDDEASEDEGSNKRKGLLKIGLGFNLDDDDGDTDDEKKKKSNEDEQQPPTKRRKKGRWDNKGSSGEKQTSTTPEKPTTPTPQVGDALDKFMEKLEAGAMGNVATQLDQKSGQEMLSIDVGGSMMRVPKLKKAPVNVNLEPASGGVITSEELAKLTPSLTKGKKKEKSSANKKANPDALYTQSDWESDSQAGGVSEVSPCFCHDDFD